MVVHVKANEFFHDQRLPDGTTVKVPGPVVKLSQTPGEVRSGGFWQGEHNYQVLSELGYTAEEIAQLYIDEVLG